MSFFQNMFGNTSANAGIIHNGGKGGQAPQTVVASTQQTQQGNQQTTTTTEGNQGDSAGNSQGSSLDKLVGFWDTPKDGEGKPIQQAADPTDGNIFNFKPEDITAAAKKLNFTAGISPELAAKALGGDAAAFSESINTAVQAAVAAMTLNAGNMINQSHATNNSRVKSTLPRHIKEVQLSQAVTTNPVLEHPAAQPLVNAMKAAAFAKDPNADPAKVTRDVEAYFAGLTEAFVEASPTAQAAKAKTAAQSTNWMEYIK